MSPLYHSQRCLSEIGLSPCFLGIFQGQTATKLSPVVAWQLAHLLFLYWPFNQNPAWLIGTLCASAACYKICKQTVKRYRQEIQTGKKVTILNQPGLRKHLCLQEWQQQLPLEQMLQRAHAESLGYHSQTVPHQMPVGNTETTNISWFLDF